MRLSVLALAIACATAGPALAQESPPASISLSPTAQLLAKGAGVRLTATVQCPAGYQGDFGGSCRQRAGRTIVSGSGGNENLTCTGSPQTVQFVITPWSGEGEQSRAFKKGQAICSAGFFACDQTGGGCVEADAPRDVVNIR